MDNQKAAKGNYIHLEEGLSIIKIQGV